MKYCYSYIWSAAIILFLAGTMALLDRQGKASRVFGRRGPAGEVAVVKIVRNSSELYAFWKQERYKGRVLVHAGRYLHYVEIEPRDVYRADAGPDVRRANLLAEYEKRINNRNFLWVAMRGNVARRIYNVLPADDFRKKLAGEGGAGSGVAVSGDELTADDRGSKRILSSRMPHIGEPVLLNLDASFFETTEPAAFIQDLRASGLRADGITLCLAEDNPEVTRTGRERLAKAARMLAGEN